MCVLLALPQHKLSKTLQNMITSWAPTCRKLRKKMVEFSLDFHAAILSDGCDKPFCTKAITIIDNFRKAFCNIDNR